MELCIARGISNLPSLNPSHFSASHIQFQPLLRCGKHFSSLPKQIRIQSGLKCDRNSSLTSTTSEEISTDTIYKTPYVENEHKPDEEVTVQDTQPVEKKNDNDFQLNEAPQEDLMTDIPQQLLKFLEDLNLKFDYEETYSTLIFGGGGGAVALWLVAAVIGAIDSIPLLPKVLELVGFGYTLWFSSRYLIFKENRDELIARIEQIKQQVIGSSNN